jgi:integrase
LRIPPDAICGFLLVAPNRSGGLFKSCSIVSEIINLRRRVTGTGAHIRCDGKGRKQRCTPLRQEITKVLDVWLRERGGMLNRHNAWAAIRKRARNAGFLTPVGCHTWRATGVTVYLENSGRLEHAQQMAAHESPRTTKLYDRTKDEITIGEVERIQL